MPDEEQQESDLAAWAELAARAAQAELLYYFELKERGYL